MTTYSKTSFNCELVNWNSTVTLCNKLAAKIKKDDFIPDIVITIARGGYVPARLICDRLDIYNLTSIRITHYTSGSAKQQQARLSIPLSIDISEMKVLLVDDIDDTGDTLNLAFKHIKSFHPKSIKTAVLHHKVISTVLPDYYVETVNKWRWIIYPWALTEDITGFINRMEQRPGTLEETRTRLEQEYGVNLTIKQLEDLLSLDDEQSVTNL